MAPQNAQNVFSYNLLIPDFRHYTPKKARFELDEYIEVPLPSPGM